VEAHDRESLKKGLPHGTGIGTEMNVAAKSLSTGLLSRILTPSRIHYLSIVVMLVRRELKVKYRGTMLGYLWSMLNPLLFMVIISVVFSHIVRGIDNYSVYVLSGILFWNMVSMSIVAGTGSIVANANLIQKVRMPLWVFPLVPLGSSLMNLALALIPYTVICLVLSVGVTWQLALLPVILVLTAVFLAGVTLCLASLNVFFRDVAHVLEPLMTLVFYATPVIYDRHQGMLPEKVSRILGLNPFVHYIEAFRATVFPGVRPVSVSDLIFLACLSITSLVVGGLIYKKSKRKIPLKL